jgi:hypothetical protein
VNGSAAAEASSDATEVAMVYVQNTRRYHGRECCSGSWGMLYKRGTTISQFPPLHPALSQRGLRYKLPDDRLGSW